MKEREEEERLEEAVEEGAGGPQEGLAETPEEEIKRLSAALEEKAKEAAQNYDRFLRSVADLENYKKRAEKERADTVSFANENLIKEILPAIDNFQRALEHAGADGEALESLRKGVSMIIEQLLLALSKFGLQEIKSVGGRFDPALQHAISEEESEAEPGTVVKEFQKGYMLKGRLLRPAMVAVAKKKETIH